MSPVPKLVVGSTFGIFPPQGGGQLRIFHLYRQLAEESPVDVIALVAGDEPRRRQEVAPGLTEVRIPKSTRHVAAETALEAQAGVPVTDVAFPELHELTPEFASAVAASAAEGGALVASHPYTLPALLAGGGLPVWYDVHNVEADLKAAMLAGNETGRRLLSAARDVERACCERAERVFASSASDAQRLRDLYGVPDRKLELVPNGVDTATISFTAPAERRRMQERLRMRTPLALFIGSWHEPNLRAVRRIAELAARMPDLEFAVVGSVGLPLEQGYLPGNMRLFGVVDDELKAALLAVAAVAINPIAEGSGTNMKMLDYLAAGLPVVSTEIGARGLDLGPTSQARIVPLERFGVAIQDVLQEPAEEADRRAREARRHVEQRFDWAVVSRPLVGAVRSDLGRPPTASVTE
jgi:glycosyltransferase involved in cell wall biosynthesis